MGFFDTLKVMKDIVVGCAAGKVNDQIVLDLSEKEDKEGQADFPIAMMPRTGEITLLQADGNLTEEEFAKATYPWELLPRIKEIVKKVLTEGLEGYHLLEEGILVGENVKIARTATIEAPAIIGPNTELRPG